MQIHSFGITDIGKARKLNEDNFISHVEDGIFLVADGMGGLSNGDLASRLAVETIKEFIVKSRKKDITWPTRFRGEYSLEENRFIAAITLANLNIFEQFPQHETGKGIGTTITGMLLDGDQLITANVGDSRIYLIRDNTVKQLTNDHSLVMEEVREGHMTLEEAKRHPQRHVINRALGISEFTQIEISSLTYKAWDLYLLCSDGLSDMITDEEILALTKKHEGMPLSEVGKNLIDAANNQGGVDNITVVLATFS